MVKVTTICEKLAKKNQSFVSVAKLLNKLINKRINMLRSKLQFINN